MSNIDVKLFKEILKELKSSTNVLAMANNNHKNVMKELASLSKELADFKKDMKEDMKVLKKSNEWYNSLITAGHIFSGILLSVLGYLLNAYWDQLIDGLSLMKKN